MMMGVVAVGGRVGLSAGHGGQHRTGFACFSAVPQTHSFVGLFAPETQLCGVALQRHLMIIHF